MLLPICILLECYSECWNIVIWNLRLREAFQAYIAEDSHHIWFTLLRVATWLISVRNSTCPLVWDKWLFTRTSKQSVSTYPLDKWKVTARLHCTVPTSDQTPLRLIQICPTRNDSHSQEQAVKILCNAYQIRTVCQLGQWQSYQC